MNCFGIECTDFVVILLIIFRFLSAIYHQTHVKFSRTMPKLYFKLGQPGTFQFLAVYNPHGSTWFVTSTGLLLPWGPPGVHPLASHGSKALGSLRPMEDAWLRGSRILVKLRAQGGQMVGEAISL